MSPPPKSTWTTLPLGRGVRELTHDSNGLVALAKPAGTLSHPNTGGDEARSLLTTRYTLAGEFYEWIPAEGAKPLRLWLLNRLDSATSGVILVAASEALANEVRAQFKRKQVRKVYNALVFGVPAEKTQLWRDLLAVNKRGGQIRTAASGNIPAQTQMTVVRQQRKSEPALALLRLEPLTGRSHQLRVQCAKRSLPIVGDATYGDFAANRAFAKRTGEKRMFLHSLETSFEYEFAGRTHRFAAHAPLPPEFELGA